MRFRLIGFLFGALLAVIPLVLHLLFQRRGPRVYFSTLRFLKQCVRKTARRKRIENLLLLLFRMALLGLLAMALAEPLIPSRLAGSGPRETVIILDNSYSMSTRQLGIERFRTAKEVAGNLLRQSGKVALIITGGPESHRPAQLAPVDNEVRSLVSNCRIFAGKADITTALVGAYSALERYGSTNGQIFVISDLQANSFPKSTDELPTDRFDRVPVIVYDCGRGAVRNAALVSLEARGGLGVAGASVELVAEVANSSDEPMKDVPVTVYLDKQALAERRVALEARGRARISVMVPLAERDVQTGWVQLGPDSLEDDNRINFRIGLRDRIDVLLVRDEQAGIGYLDESFFLARALDPRPAGAPSGSLIRPTRILTSALSEEQLSGMAVVYLLNVGNVDDDTVKRLARYVRGGGNLFILPGDRVTPEGYSRLISAQRPGALLAAELADSTGDDRMRERSWKVIPTHFNHPFLEKFRGLGAPIFERITAYRFHHLVVGKDSKIQVLANLVPDQNAVGDYPFLVVGDLGKGKVIFASCPATTLWSDFPAAKIFVPLMHEVVYSLAGGIGRTESHTAGQPVRLDFADCREPVSVSVDFGAGRIRQFTSKPSPAGNFVIIDESHVPGIYPVKLSGGRTGSDAFVINPDPAEGDLTRVTPAELEGHFAHGQLSLAASEGELEAALDRIEGGIPLTSGLFLVVIVIAVAELVVANRTRPGGSTEGEVKPFATVSRERTGDERT